jgi:hypothetical protein
MPTGQWTIKGNTAYYWCNRWPGKELAIGGLQVKVQRALFLATGDPIAFEQTENRLILKGLRRPILMLSPACVSSNSNLTRRRARCWSRLRRALGVEPGSRQLIGGCPQRSLLWANG